MRIKQYVRMDLIDIDRRKLCPKTLAYAQAMQGGAKFPPVRLQKMTGGRFLLKDGRHRWAAAKLLGKKTLWAKFYKEEQP